MCLYKTCLYSIISSNDSNLQVRGHTLVHTHNPNNTKRGAACIYYLNSLPLKVLRIQFLNKCINPEKNIGGKVWNYLCLYRSPSQSRDTFETFAVTLDTLTKNNPFLIVAIDDFNAKATGIRIWHLTKA